MQKQEAINRLQRISKQASDFVESSPSHYWSDIYRKDAEAFEMAIKALQGQKGDCGTCKFIKTEWDEEPCVNCGGYDLYERAER